MKMTNVFKEDEKAVYKLRELYREYGYSHYKVSKFEEYDLYANNKNFLVSEKLLTFTDTNGKLMALKPDVTLSIIKNAVADAKASYRLYYDEHVYRTPIGGDGFREITQMGLESIGNLDTYAQSEVIMLAIKSMESISDDCILDISHMKFLEGLLENAGIDSKDMSAFFKLIESKNIPELRTLCEKWNVSPEWQANICKITSMYLPIDKAIEEIKNIVAGEKMQIAYDDICEIYKALECYSLCKRVYLDFSIVNDMNYYDGVIFKGFINGIPDGILSGGRYDRLMERFGKKTEAIGFAVYLDKLERFGMSNEEYDVDVMIVYDSDMPTEKIIESINAFKADNKTVKAVNAVDRSVKCRQYFSLTKDGELREANDKYSAS